LAPLICQCSTAVGIEGRVHIATGDDRRISDPIPIDGFAQRGKRAGHVFDVRYGQIPEGGDAAPDGDGLGEESMQLIPSSGHVRIVVQAILNNEVSKSRA